MKNTKNTRVQKQQKKAKKQRRISSTLMCGLVLSGVALPAVAVLADNAVQSQTPASTQKVPTTSTSEAVDKVAEQTATDSTTSTTEKAKTSDVVNDESQFANNSQAFAPDDNPFANKAPEGGYASDQNADLQADKVVEGTATIHFLDKATGNKVKEDMEVKGNSQQDIRTVAGKDAFNISGWVLIQEPNTFYPFKEGHTEYTAYYTADESQETKYALGADGYYHWVEADGSLNQVNRFVDATITYTNAKTGEVLGTDTQIKADANALVISSTMGHEFDANTWGIAEGASEWIDPNSAMQVGDKTFYSNLMIFTDPEISANNGNGKVVTPQNGNINLTVPLTNMTEAPEEDYVDFSIRYVDEDGKDLAPVESEHLPVGSSIDVVAKDFSMQGYKLKDGEKTEVQQTVTKGMGDIVFHYEEDKETYSKLQFKFVDSKTGKEIKKAYTEVSLPGGAYVIDPTKDEFKVDGYKLQSKYYENEDTSSVIYTFPDKGTTQTVELKYDADSKPDPVKQGSVTFKYVDKDSKELKAPKTVKGDVDSKFSEKAPTIEGYTLDTEKSDATVEGKFTEQGQTYYFVYNKDEKPSEDTTKIRAELEKDVKDAKQYVNKDKYQASYVDALSKEIDSAQSFLDANKPKTDVFSSMLRAVGIKSDSDKTLTEQYQAHIDSLAKAVDNVKANPVAPTPDEEGTVTFKYVDAGSHQLKEPKTVTGKVGDKFSEKAPTIKGYTLDTTKSDETKTGTFTKAGQTYYFVYNKDSKPDPVKQGSVTVSYVDEDGKSIQDSKTIKGDVGSKFSEKAPTIKGYTLTSDSTLSGTFTEQAQSIKFTYKKDATPAPTPTEQGTVNIWYMAYGMDVLKETKVLKGNVGDKFHETAPEIEGYELWKEKSNVPEEGTFTSGTQNFYFIYKPVDKPTPDPAKQGTINFKFVDESGKEIKAMYVSQNTVGNTIKVSDSDFFHIDGYKLKTGAKEYTYTGETQTVTLTYSKVEDDNGGNTNNNSSDSGNSTTNGADTNAGNKTDNGNKTNANGDSASANKNSSFKSEVKPLATDTAKENKATLPTTGEANTFWLFLSGLGVLLATGLALVFKRKHN